MPHRTNPGERSLLANRRILDLEAEPEALVPFAPEALGELIAAGDPRWRDLVPAAVQERIGDLKL